MSVLKILKIKILSLSAHEFYKLEFFKCYISLSILPKSIISFLNSYMKFVWKKKPGTYMKQYDDK